MVKSKVIRVHPLFYDALVQMRKDLEKIEKQLFQDPELTRRIALRMTERRLKYAKKHKSLFD